MALAGNLGVQVDMMEQAALFGEDQARYVLTCKASEAAKIITQAHVKGIDVIRIGTVSGSGVVRFGTVSLPLSVLRDTHESWFPKFMAG